MGKRVREVPLDTRTAREKLKPRGKPYYRAIDQGLHLGYRKGLKGGQWVVRRYIGDGKYAVETIGSADDNQDADGGLILNFSQAQNKARGLAAGSRLAAAGPTPAVRDAIQAYCEGREKVHSTGEVGLKRDARSRLSKHVLSDPVAGTALHKLTENALAEWRDRLSTDITPSTVRRVTNDFRAALNAAAKKHRARLPADLPLVIKNGLAAAGGMSSNAREAQVLPDADVRRLIELAWAVDENGGWDGDLARLVIVLAATGARFSQVIRMTVADVRPQGRLMVPVSRKGHGEKSAKKVAVRVGDDVITALHPAVAGRKGPQPLFERWRWRRQAKPMKWIRERRGSWTSAAELARPWKTILAKAGLPDDTVPYALRHSSIVRGLRAGLPVRLVAALHDTSSVMIEKHYSAYIVDAMDELAARAVVPLTSAPVRHIRPVEQARR
jgi:integrase